MVTLSIFDILLGKEMKVQRIFAMDQNSDEAEELAIKNGTTKSICGYVVCAVCEYLAEQDHVTE